jgi:hypothetical protein
MSNESPGGPPRTGTKARDLGAAMIAIWLGLTLGVKNIFAKIDLLRACRSNGRKDAAGALV